MHGQSRQQVVEHRDTRRDVRFAASSDVYPRAGAPLPGRSHGEGGYPLLASIRGPAPLAVDAVDLGAERPQAFVDSLVALIDLVHGPDRRRAFGAETREQHRHPRTDVRAFHPLPAQFRGPGDHGTMGIAKDDAGSHAHELVGEEQPVLEHLLEHEDRPLRLSRDRERDGGEVGGERRPRPVFDLRNVTAEVVLHDELLAWWHAHEVVTELDLDAELLEAVQDRHQVGPLDSVDRHVAAGDRRETDETPHLDVIGADLPLPAAERLDALDAEHVRLNALDLRTQQLEETAEILDVRLTGGVADHGLAGRERGRHDSVLGRHDARFVEEDVLAVQRAAAQLVAAADLDLRAQLGEGVDVRVEPAPADHVPAGRRRAHAPHAGKQWTDQEERCTHPAAQLLVELGLDDRGGMNLDV